MTGSYQNMMLKCVIFIRWALVVALRGFDIDAFFEIELCDDVVCCFFR